MIERKNTVHNKYEKIKILTLGNSKVGKSSFIYKYTENFFQLNYLSTQGIDYLRKVVELPNGNKYSVVFCDTAGQERFRSITLNVIKKCDGILLMYDITDKISFDSIHSWMEQIKDNKGENYPIILCGNKCDLEKERVISKKEGEDLAKEYGVHFYEISNLNGQNIENTVNDLISQIREQKLEIIKDFEVIDENNFQLKIQDLKRKKSEGKDLNSNERKSQAKKPSKCL